MRLSRFATWPLAAGVLLSLGLAGCIPKLGSTFGGGSDAEQTSSADPTDAQIAILAEDETIYSPVDIAPSPSTKPGSEAPEAVAEATGEASVEDSAESEPESPSETTTAEASPETLRLAEMLVACRRTVLPVPPAPGDAAP